MYKEVRFTVVVDYKGLNKLKTKRGPLGSPSAVGLSVYVEALKDDKTLRILFDTSSSWKLLYNNSKLLGIDLRNLDAVIISHWHIDHTGGLPALMKYNPDVIIYAPPEGTKLSPLDMFVHFRLPRRPRIVNEPMEIFEEVFIIGPLRSYFPLPPFPVREQALAIKLEESKVALLVGCSHPKVYRFVEKALEITGSKRIALLIGGFHLIFPTTKREAKVIVEKLGHMPIDKVAPLHCSGDLGKRFSKEILGERHLDVVAGETVIVTKDSIRKERRV
jgi:7,8-dihydropterin-6-yl-methyl-4-(beta-D-ribofuranosyl)aminobenzene 5'-phosphate synthase